MENLSNGQVPVKVNGVSDNEIDLEFLPLIYEIIKRDPTHDTTQKTRESQDAALKILELEKKLNQAREQINRLPGIELSQEEQLKQVDSLRKQVALKRQLLNKYRNLCSFSMPK
ncbi:UNVERIFIED_CONTAM: hypothetical protein PYX00_008930 [Menopon gallinae]|uniref:Mediator of RNA polymerase II transcription subunit 9 n=1 Tax=Menopon gallinae TaxID=328185 RepID=A0AAW2H986_9NEOP